MCEGADLGFIEKRKKKKEDSDRGFDSLEPMGSDGDQNDWEEDG